MNKIILELHQSKLTKISGFMLLIFGIVFFIYPIWGYITIPNVTFEKIKDNIFLALIYYSAVTFLIRYSILVTTANRILKVKKGKLIITSKWKMYNKSLNLDDMVSWIKVDDTGAGSGGNIFIKADNQKLRLSSYEFMGLRLLEDYLRENYEEYEI